MSVTVPGGTTVRLHRLTMVAEDDGVMVGRPDTGSYAVFPEEGAQVLRLLDAGGTVADAAAWYARTCGETLDMEDFLAAVDDLGFLRADNDAPDAAESVPAPVRWQRLGRWTFSRPALVCYGVLVTAALAAMVNDPALRPSYHQLMFTSHISLIAVTLFGAAIPCILAHEGFHALAGRRLGLPSTLGIGRRLYYLVAETRMDTLLSVERRHRYLPFLAGMLADVLLVSVFTLTSAGLSRTGAPGWLPALFLAVSFTCVLRLIWQFLFYLETDLYYVAATALRCTDLQSATRFHLRALIRRRLRRPPPRADTEWSEHDRAMARRYAPVLVSGYAFSLASLAWAAVPTALTFWSTAIHRFTRAGTPAADLFDAAFFVALTTCELGLLLYVTVRDGRAKSRTATAARRGASA